jgi:hypothetical protein
LHVDRRCPSRWLKVDVSDDEQVTSWTITELSGIDKLYLSVTVDKIPDDVLLEIFDFYLVSSSREDAWQTLVHVCKRWRCIVFASPRRLHLELLCTNRRPVKKTMDIWPELPVVIKAASWNSRNLGVNNVASALKQHHRVCTIDIPGS